ncbi:hypothetical protein PENSPDRAFT_753508 [Peniophora sp. CONT]|nr:hypothetical protein PENSPDRAFT_753508 [Peniophora sp. CONT]
MNISGPSTTHRRGTTARTRENQIPRTFLRARGGLGDAPTTTATSATEDDGQPRRNVKKRHRGTYNHTPTPVAGPSEEMDKPLPRTPNKTRLAQLATSTARATETLAGPSNVRPAKSSSKAHKRMMALPISFVAETDEEGYDSQSTLGRPSAASSELSKLQAQVLDLKKQLQTKAKEAEDHSKHLNKYRREVQNLHKSSKEQRAELEKLRVQHQRNAKIVNDVEQSLQCQICIDTLSRPFALSPCGHVLCQVCLQDWFRQAPVSPEDMDTDDELPSLIHRTKSCPVCRARIRSRPLQLYMLKSIISSIDKARAGPSRASPPLELDDPWEGIFPPLTTEVSDAELDSSDDEEDEDSDDASSMDDDGGLLDVYDNSSDDDYEGDWVSPTWEPPHDLHPRRLHTEPFFDSLLRRGATLLMIQKYDMDYTHDEGLSMEDEEGEMKLYLGWNIRLAEDDPDGSRFVEWCFEDLEARGERWRLEDGGTVGVRLVRSDGERYEEGDSEEWIGSESEEDVDEDEEMN